MTSALHACAVLFPWLAGPGIAGDARPALEPAPRPHVAVPSRAVAVQPAPGGRFEMIDDWIVLEPTARGAVGDCSDGVAFDAAALNPDTFFPQPPDPNCAIYATFGAAFRNVRHANDFQVEAIYAGRTSHEVAFLWFNGVEGEHQYIALSTYETGSPLTCGIDTSGDGWPDTPMTGHLSSWVFDMGVRPRGSYVAHVPLCADPVGFRLPADGAGMYEMIIARSYEDTDNDGAPDTLVPATLAQPLLYYNEHDFDGDGVADWRLAGSQTPVQFDDRAPWNGQYDLADLNADGVPDECYVYDFVAMGLCPRYRSSAVMFWGDGAAAPPCPGDANGDRRVDLSDLALILASFGSCVGSPGFNPGADLVPNGCVDLSDLSLLLGRFGSTCG